MLRASLRRLVLPMPAFRAMRPHMDTLLFFLRSFSGQLFTSDVLASVALVVSLLAARLVAGRALKAREHLPPQVVRRWTANVRNLLLLVAFAGLVMIWAPQLRTFALSLTAVAVAVVVATKELILCLSGSALRTFTRSYSVGDYVEIGGTRGEVLDYNLLATTLYEFDKREGSFTTTGRNVIVPHSMLFGSPTRTEGTAGARVRHVFEMNFEPEVNLFAKRASIARTVKEAQARCEDEHARTSPRSDVKAHGSHVPAARIGFGTTEIGKYRLEIMISALPELVGETESAIACALGDWQHELRTSEPGGAASAGGAADASGSASQASPA